jgi:hypothetical protein
MQHRNRTPTDTEKEIQTKFKYPAETPANAAKIPRQMSLFIKQGLITSKLRIDSQTPATQGKYYPSIPKKLKHPRKYENQIIIATFRLKT